MGRRNKSYSKDLHQQAYDRLTGMQAFGESKKEAVANTGYVVIASMEKEQRYKDGNRRWRTVTLWETVIETPYVVSFEVDEIRSLIQELFTEDADGCWMIQRIGINGNCPEGYTKMIEDPEWRKVYPEHNVMLERRLKANYRTGYWEIIFLHTKPLGPVPADMKMC